jgi:hypothetical protein
VTKTGHIVSFSVYGNAQPPSVSPLKHASEPDLVDVSSAGTACRSPPQIPPEPFASAIPRCEYLHGIFQAQPVSKRGRRVCYGTKSHGSPGQAARRTGVLQPNRGFRHAAEGGEQTQVAQEITGARFVVKGRTPAGLVRSSPLTATLETIVRSDEDDAHHHGTYSSGEGDVGTVSLPVPTRRWKGVTPMSHESSPSLHPELAVHLDRDQCPSA